MDLHDYKDVAENYDRYLDVMYNQEFDKHEGFQEFYLGLSRKYGKDGVIDVACGTGAVLLYLAEQSVHCSTPTNTLARLRLFVNITPTTPLKA